MSLGIKMPSEESNIDYDPEEISFLRTLLQPAAFLFGFALLIGLHVFFQSLIDRLDQQTSNEQARLFIGEQIVESLNNIESDVYKMATTLGIKGQRLVRKEITNGMVKIYDLLRILQEGGEYRKTIRLNLQGHDQMIRKVTYNPTKEENEFILEVIDLRPKLAEVDNKISQLMALLEEREKARKQVDRMHLSSLELGIKKFLKLLPPQFVRMRENANRLFFESQHRLLELQNKINKQQYQYELVEIFLIFVIVLIVVGFGIVRSRQIIDSNKQLQMALGEMKIARDEAEYANMAKSRFLSSMSHELRTPLNAILGFAQLFGYSNNNLNDIQKSNIDEIDKAGRHLLVLIDDVLDLARIEAGGFDLSFEDIDLRVIMSECQSLTKPLAEEQGIKVFYECLEDPIQVTADYTRLKQVILNLVTNAVKYNREDGNVKILCRMSGNEKVRIIVQDTGMGIEKRYLDQLFEPFNRLGIEGKNIEGTGIGLVITRQLIELMDGSIGVDSEEGVGSSFWVDLPGRVIIEGLTEIENSHPEEIAPVPQVEETKIASAQILIVEDNPVNQALLLQQVKLLGYSAEIAPNGQEARQYLREGTYDLLMTDCNMPVMDGYQLARSIRQDELKSSRHLPIIAITANAMSSEDDKCFAAGMDDYLPKPVDIGQLEKLINKWLPPGRSKRKNAKKKKGNSHRLEKERETPPVDLSALIEQVGDNPDIYKSFIQLFIDSSPKIIDAILRGKEERSSNKIVFSAHKLKSSAAAIGAYSLADMASDLESNVKHGDWMTIDRMCETLEVLFKGVEKYLVTQMESDSDITADESSSITDEFSKLRILLVDDDPIMLGQITLILNNLGVKDIRKTSDGREALKVLEANGYSAVGIDLVLCDLNMPEMDGASFVRYLAERNYQGDIAFISGMDKQVLKAVGELGKAHKLNVLGILEKPVSREMISELLQQVKHRVPLSVPAINNEKLTEEELRNGISQGAVSVRYQPKVNVKTGDLVGAEALARWFDPRRGSISPGEFIPLIEKYGLMKELTETIFKQAIEQAARWRADGLEFKIAVNFSMSCFNTRLDLPDWLENEITRVNIEPANIIIEVTESGLMDNRTTALEVLSRIRMKGFTLSIDDFGTGFSSMKQLQRLPFTELKIDRSFVTGAVTDVAKRAIFESSAELAKKLGLLVVVEGVESREEWNLAKELDCDLMQGYFIGKPMTIEVFDKWMAKWNKGVRPQVR